MPETHSLKWFAIFGPNDLYFIYFLTFINVLLSLCLTWEKAQTKIKNTYVNGLQRSKLQLYFPTTLIITKQNQ